MIEAKAGQRLTEDQINMLPEDWCYKANITSEDGSLNGEGVWACPLNAEDLKRYQKDVQEGVILLVILNSSYQIGGGDFTDTYGVVAEFQLRGGHRPTIFVEELSAQMDKWQSQVE